MEETTTSHSSLMMQELTGAASRAGYRAAQQEALARASNQILDSNRMVPATGHIPKVGDVYRVTSLVMSERELLDEGLRPGDKVVLVDVSGDSFSCRHNGNTIFRRDELAWFDVKWRKWEYVGTYATNTETEKPAELGEQLKAKYADEGKITYSVSLERPPAQYSPPTVTPVLRRMQKIHHLCPLIHTALMCLRCESLIAEELSAHDGAIKTLVAGKRVALEKYEPCRAGLGNGIVGGWNKRAVK